MQVKHLTIQQGLMMNIYSFATFNLTKVLLTAQELNLPYQLHLFDIKKTEHKSEQHLNRHPLGKVPAVEIDGKNYFESNAICRLLAERNNNQLYGDTPEERAEVNQWIDFLTLHIGRWLTVAYFEQSLKPNLFGGKTNLTSVDEAHSFLFQQLPIIEQQLAKHAFIASEQFSIADIIAYSYFSTTAHSDVAMNEYPNITQWLKSIESRVSFTRAMTDIPGNDMFSILKNS